MRFHLLRRLLSQAQRMPARKHQSEATGGPAGKMQNRCCRYLTRPNASLMLSLCPLTLMWHGCFILSSRTQRDFTEKMDSTESPQHQTSAHVCYGQYMCIVCSTHTVCLLHIVFHSHSLILGCRCFQKWHLSKQPSPYGGTPGLRSCKTNLQPQQEVRARNHVNFIMCSESFYTNPFKQTVKSSVGRDNISGTAKNKARVKHWKTFQEQRLDHFFDFQFRYAKRTQHFKNAKMWLFNQTAMSK